MPEEIVLDGFDQQRRFQQVDYLGKKVIVETKDEGKGVIVQLLSSDPHDFLDKHFSPGTEIFLH
ncbi:YlzJ-like family protein [Candidatus Formimonas warabiya]